ncbi:hypothetical protein, partial [Enterovibrio norvegicus]|uniref:hypothetical protein n=1 Tax=Enterovibrio norvegicus TaxID=188144 RepID=UPI0013015905
RVVVLARPLGHVLELGGRGNVSQGIAPGEGAAFAGVFGHRLGNHIATGIVTVLGHIAGNQVTTGFSFRGVERLIGIRHVLA